MRQIILDTETTGLDPAQGHRIIEIGCVEVVNRRLTGNTWHRYLNPGRDIDAGAIEVHGITTAFLADKPCFPDIAREFLEFVKGAELVIHNAPFDVGFINHELRLLLAGVKGDTPLTWCLGKIEDGCAVVDTLALARRFHPGQKNDLDSLCRRYEVDSSQRTLHGALLDAEILADVYLAMTGGQAGLFEDQRGSAVAGVISIEILRLDPSRPPLPILVASVEELAAHQAWLEEIDKKSGGQCVWKNVNV